MLTEYGSSPVEQPALQILSVRGFFQNFFVCNSGSTRFSNASYTPGYRKKLVSCVSSRSSRPSYSTLDLRMARSSSVPRSIPFCAQMFPHSRGEEALARFIEANSRPLFDQHANLAQLVFVWPLPVSLAFAHRAPVFWASLLLLPFGE